MLASFTQNAGPTPLPLVVLMLTVASATYVLIHVGSFVATAFCAWLVSMFQLVTLCQGRIAPAVVDPRVPAVVLALVNASVTVTAGINSMPLL